MKYAISITTQGADDEAEGSLIIDDSGDMASALYEAWFQFPEEWENVDQLIVIIKRVME